MFKPLQFKPSSKLVIERTPAKGNDDHVHIVLRGQTNHELRCILIGLWATLPADDQAEHIEELKHYHADPAHTFLPGLSNIIATALGKPWDKPAESG